MIQTLASKSMVASIMFWPLVGREWPESPGGIFACDLHGRDKVTQNTKAPGGPGGILTCGFSASENPKTLDCRIPGPPNVLT